MIARPPPVPPASVVDAAAYTRQSRTYEPDDPDLRGKRVRPFRLDELEHIPREHRDVQRALSRILPEIILEPTFVSEVCQQLQQYTEMDIDVWLHTVRIARRTQLRAMIPGVTCLVVVGLPPLSDKIIVEIDLRFVYKAVDRLLGSHGVAVDIHRPLTEIEQGVFSFLLLKVLHLFQRDLEFPEQVAVRLEDIRNDLKSVADIVRHDDYWLVAAWKMNFDLDVGYVRTLVPTSIVRRLVPEQMPRGSALAKRFRERIHARMDRLRSLTVDCPIEVGHIELTPDDIRALDPGDIVLLDHCELRLQDGEPVGPARMTVGLGRSVVLNGIVGGQAGGSRRQLAFQIQQMEVRRVPPAHDPHIVHGMYAHPEEVMAEYEEPRYDDANDDGDPTYDDVIDEEYGLDDESEGDDEQYYEEYGEEEYGDQSYDAGPAEHADPEHPPDPQAPVSPSPEAGIEAGPMVEAEALLGDIPVNVVVEIGRVRLTADEVLRLGTGHIVELGRSPAEPVDLVVNGRLLAKGELVEIEGALGVKILSLLKEPDA